MRDYLRNIVYEIIDQHKHNYIQAHMIEVIYHDNDKDCCVGLRYADKQEYVIAALTRNCDYIEVKQYWTTYE